MMLSYDRWTKLFKIPQEISNEDKVGENWMKSGKVEFKDFNLRYRPDTELVLKDLNFTIQPSQTIGVVGRTGSGKSTLCLALWRIVEGFSGKILIDGEDISLIPLDNLRSHIAIIPQDPELFEGTLKFNIDPTNTHSDEEIEALLIECSWKILLERDPKRLDQHVEEKGLNLSCGEKQLICICRAILRKNKLVLMDEATANIDIKTEEIIQKLIHERFEGSTVITIAHRLNTIISR